MKVQWPEVGYPRTTIDCPHPPPAGVVHADLKLFLETNLPISGKKKAALGVSDGKIGAALQEEFNLSIQTGGVVAEISRGETHARFRFFVTLI